MKRIIILMMTLAAATSSFAQVAGHRTDQGRLAVTVEASTTNTSFEGYNFTDVGIGVGTTYHASPLVAVTAGARGERGLQNKVPYLTPFASVELRIFNQRNTPFLGFEAGYTIPFPTSNGAVKTDTYNWGEAFEYMDVTRDLEELNGPTAIVGDGEYYMFFPDEGMKTREMTPDELAARGYSINPVAAETVTGGKTYLTKKGPYIKFSAGYAFTTPQDHIIKAGIYLGYSRYLNGIWGMDDSGQLKHFDLLGVKEYRLTDENGDSFVYRHQVGHKDEEIEIDYFSKIIWKHRPNDFSEFSGFLGFSVAFEF